MGTVGVDLVVCQSKDQLDYRTTIGRTSAYDVHNSDDSVVARICLDYFSNRPVPGPQGFILDKYDVTGTEMEAGTEPLGSL